jgi:hypothetical protein
VQNPDFGDKVTKRDKPLGEFILFDLFPAIISKVPPEKTATRPKYGVYTGIGAGGHMTH